MRALTGWMYTDAVNQVDCPKCKAVATQYCRTPKGRKAWPPHGERVQEVQKKFPASTWTRSVQSGNDIINLLLGKK